MNVISNEPLQNFQVLIRVEDSVLTPRNDVATRVYLLSTSELEVS